MKLVYENNAQSTLDLELSETGTELTLVTGAGILFPDIDAGDNSWFPLTLIRRDATGHEIVHATARNGETVTIERGKENTPTAIAFAAGDIVMHAMTSAAFDEFVRNGSSNVVLPAGFNVALQTNVSMDPVELSLPEITELTDGLRISFRPAVENTGAVSIKLNDFDAKTLNNRQDDSVAIIAGDLRPDQLVSIQFVQGSGAGFWLLETALNRNPQTAAFIRKGVVETSNTNLSDDVFNLDEEPTLNSGAPVVFTRRAISRIIKDWADNHPDEGLNDAITQYLQSQPSLAFDPQWSYFGGARSGDVVVDSAGSISPVNGVECATFTVDAQGILTIGSSGVMVIKATESIVIDGRVVFGDAHVGNPHRIVGPRGGGAVNQGLGNELTEGQPGFVFQNSGAGVTKDAFENAVRQAIPFHSFHGGSSDSYRDPPLEVFGRGGLVLIAPNISIRSRAEFFMPTRNNNGSPNSITSGTGARSDGIGGGAGGMLVACSNTLSVSDTAGFKVDDPDQVEYQDYSVIRQGGTTPAQPFFNAGHGQFFQIDLDANAVTELI